MAPLPTVLAWGTNGDLYGTTYFGGAHPWGTVFSLTTNGVFATLASFMETNGANPTAAPVQGADGEFYGTTFYGGAFGAGTVYSMAADGTLATLFSFTGNSDGARPSGELVQGPDGGFYGLRQRAGGLFEFRHCLPRKCLILDIVMPGIGGPDLERELERRKVKCPVIFITGQRDEGLRSRLLEDAAIDCLFKPFSDMALQRALDSALKGK